MLVKFISENRVDPYRGLVEAEGVIYTNDEGKAKELGYKPLIKEKTPEVPEGYYPMSYYEEGENAVYMRWKLEPVSVEEV